MLKTIMAGAVVAALGVAPLSLFAAAAQAQGAAPMEAAGPAGEHRDMRAMQKAGTMKKGHMKHMKTKKHM